MVTRNIVLLPPPEVAEKAIEWSWQIASAYQTNFILDGKQFYPHVSLFQGEYTERGVPSLVEQLTHIARSVSPFQIQATTFRSFKGFLLLEIETNDALVSLQKMIYSHAVLFGKSLSPLAGKMFAPHVTITRLQRPEESDKAVSLLGATNIEFTVHNYYLTNIGSDGTVNELVKEFPFQMI